MASRKIEDLYPPFGELVKQFLNEANEKTKPWKTFITDGYRSDEEQAKLYAQGRTSPGRIVTNAKPGYSWHGHRLAVDIAFQKDGKLSYANNLYNKIVPIAHRLGLTWGGDWRGFTDKPHFEWHTGVTLAQARAGKRPTRANMPKNTIRVDKKTFERLVDNSTRYDAITRENIRTPEDVTKIKRELETERAEVGRLRSELQNATDDLKREVGTAKDREKEKEKSHKNFLENLASKLRPEIPSNEEDVAAEIGRLAKVEDHKEKLERKVEVCEKEVVTERDSNNRILDLISGVVGYPIKTEGGLRKALNKFTSRVSKGKEVKMAKKKGFSLAEAYAGLPKEARVLPYLILSAVITVLIDQLTSFKFDNLVVMGVSNIVLIFLKQLRTRINR